MESFVEVYDISKTSFKVFGPGFWISLLFIGVGAQMFIYPESIHGPFKHPGLQKMFGAMLVTVTSLGGTYILISDYIEHSALQNGYCIPVEGRVEKYEPHPRTGFKKGTFIVKGLEFSYSYSDLSHTGFNNTNSYGKPLIRQGSMVRICYVDTLNKRIIVFMEVDS